MGLVRGTSVVRMVLIAAAMIVFLALFIAVRRQVTPLACSVMLGCVALILVGVAGVLWDYGRTARVLVRLLQRRERWPEETK